MPDHDQCQEPDQEQTDAFNLDGEDDAKAEQPSEAERKSNLINALDAIDDELGPKGIGAAKQSDPVKIHGMDIEVDEAYCFACPNCGVKRFHTTFAIGHPAGYHYNTRYSCNACGKHYTREQVLKELAQAQDSVG